MKTFWWICNDLLQEPFTNNFKTLKFEHYDQMITSCSYLILKLKIYRTRSFVGLSVVSSMEPITTGLFISLKTQFPALPILHSNSSPNKSTSFILGWKPTHWCISSREMTISITIPCNRHNPWLKSPITKLTWSYMCSKWDYVLIPNLLLDSLCKGWKLFLNWSLELNSTLRHKASDFQRRTTMLSLVPTREG